MLLESILIRFYSVASVFRAPSSASQSLDKNNLICSYRQATTMACSSVQPSIHFVHC